MEIIVLKERLPPARRVPKLNHVKIYYDNAPLLVDLPGKTGVYESVQRRPLFYQTNVLHRNSLKGWKWASDIFGALLIFITVSGWFMLKGKNVIGGRGKWLIAAGVLPPVAALIIFDLLQKQSAYRRPAQPALELEWRSKADATS